MAHAGYEEHLWALQEGVMAFAAAHLPARAWRIAVDPGLVTSLLVQA